MEGLEEDWWLNEQRKDPEWVAWVEAQIEMARVNREEMANDKEKD